MNSPFLNAIRAFEGFTPQAQWDYAQFSNGYGTRAKYAGEVIDKAEADRRFEAAVTNARSVVEKHASARRRRDEGGADLAHLQCRGNVGERAASARR